MVPAVLFIKEQLSKVTGKLWLRDNAPPLRPALLFSKEQFKKLNSVLPFVSAEPVSRAPPLFEFASFHFHSQLSKTTKMIHSSKSLLKDLS